MSDKIITPRFRLSFPALFVPKAVGTNPEPRYSLNMLFTKDADLSLLKKAAMAAVREKWGDKPPKNLRSPFRDGSEKEYDGYAGMIYVNAWTKTKPGVVDAQVQTIIAPDELYAGCWCVASVRAFAYENSGNTGVSFALMNVQKVADGDRFDNRSKPEDDFQALAGETKAETAAPKTMLDAAEAFFQ